MIKMSQHWHAHWANESFEPKRLRNWEVSNWHPPWPGTHSYPTVFQSDNKGHSLPGIPKCKDSAWGHFKGTWELPRNINRRCAEELSSYLHTKKKVAWMKHEAKYHATCKEFDKAILKDEVKISADKNSRSKETLHKDSSSDHERHSLLPIDKEKVGEVNCLKHYTYKV